MSMIWETIGRQVNDAHAEIQRERDRRALEVFDEAWASRPIMVDNGPVIVAWLVPLAIGLAAGAVLHMAWVAL